MQREWDGASSLRASRDTAAGWPIVLIGSAGGYDAIDRFFSAAPPNPGMTYIVMPHLDSARESTIVKRIAARSRMPVREAQHGASLEKDQVYVAPPDKRVTVKGSTVLLSELEPGSPESAIDTALQALAAEQQERAIGIIMSGSGRHGTIGLREIKSRGGIAIVQEPATAEQPQMPRHAIEAGLADYVLSPEQMPEVLASYARHPFAQSSELPAQRLDPMRSDGAGRVLALLKERRQYDFGQCRRSMVMRRIQRRMALRNIDDVDRYVELVREHPDEADALYKDLLIGVTAFFREQGAFDVLATDVLPELLQRAGHLRVWVAGCATGQEAYSIAMLLAEQTGLAADGASFRIFATDVDEESLGFARRGIYPASIAADVTEERLARFFVRLDDRRYQVVKSLRESIVFASHDLVSDPPFSNIDLISCRNLLVYLEPTVHARVVPLLHFALKPGGCLMLASAESLGAAADLFTTASRRWRIFRKPPAPPAEASALRAAAPETCRPPASPDPSRRLPRGWGELMGKVLAEEFSPASLLVDAQHRILAAQGPVADYLEFPTGSLASDMLTLVRHGLRARLGRACTEVARCGQTVRDDAARVKRDGSYVACSIVVRPLIDPGSAERLFLVVFRDRTDAAPRLARGGEDSIDEAALTRQLEDELDTTREDFSRTIHELVCANEELKASNEALLSINEELRSKNDELETSMEELQSLHEEASAVNALLREKVDELDAANNDMSGFLAASDVATVFVDTELKIQRFTPSTGTLFSLLPRDIGRPFRDFAPKFRDDSLMGDCEQVMVTLESIDKEVRTEEHRWYLRRISPYTREDGSLGGVVITFFDISRRYAAEARARLLAESEIRRLNLELAQEAEQRVCALEAGEKRIRAILDSAADGIVTIDAHGIIESFNDAAARMFGYSAREAVGQNVRMLMPSPVREEHDEYLRRYQRTREPRIIGQAREVTACRKDGSSFPVELSVRAVNGLGLFTASIRDLSERKALQEEILHIAALEQQRVGQELHDTVQQELTGLALLAGNLRDGLAGRDVGGKGLLASKLSRGIDMLHQRVHLLAEGFVPEQVSPDELIPALRALAARTAEVHGIECRFDDSTPVTVETDVTATHLLRIAQEAVTNSVKHAKPKSVRIALSVHGQELELSVEDDGDGIRPQAIAASASGLGLRIMNYRSALIGGRLNVERREHGGTIVGCRVPYATRQEETRGNDDDECRKSDP